MTDHAISKIAYDAACQMAADGAGWEDIVVRLKVPPKVARIIVHGKKHRVRQAS